MVTASSRLSGACLGSSNLVGPCESTTKRLLFVHSISTVWEECVELRVTNSSPMPVKLFHGTKIGQFTALEQVQVVDWCRSKPNMPLHSHPTLTCLNLPCQQPRRRSCWHPCTILAVSLLRRVNLRKGQQWSNITLKHLDLQLTTTMPIASIQQGGGRKGDPGYASNWGDLSKH